MKKILIIFILLLCTNYINVQAYEEDVTSVNETGQVQQLYDYITHMQTEYDMLKNMDVKSYVQEFIKNGNGGFSVSKLCNALTNYMFKEIGASLKLMISLIIIAIVCALLNNLQTAFSNESLSNIAYFACYSMLIIFIAKSFYIGLELCKGTITKITDFMAALIPVLMTLLASVGGFSQAAMLDPIIIGAINLSARIYINFIIPLILLSFVLQFVNNISEEYKINKLTKLLNQIAVWAQGITMTIFIGIISIRGMVSKTLDQVTAKTAKFAVDNFVPIIGKCLSDAISTVAGYSLLLKNALSSLGLIVILIIVIFPIVKLAILALLYRFTAAIIEPISDSRLVNCISSVGDSLVLITTCLISVSVMFFIMIAIIATAGQSILGG